MVILIYKTVLKNLKSNIPKKKSSTMVNIQKPKSTGHIYIPIKSFNTGGTQFFMFGIPKQSACLLSDVPYKDIDDPPLGSFDCKHNLHKY